MGYFLKFVGNWDVCIAMSIFMLQYLRAFAIDNHDEVITSAIRGFGGGDLITLIRQRPSMPLIGLLYRKLTTFDSAYVAKRKYVILICFGCILISTVNECCVRLKSEKLEKLIEHVPNTQVKLKFCIQSFISNTSNCFVGTR